jgi:hypothetical protein
MIAGQLVSTDRAVHWDGQTESSEKCSFGAYFYQIEADGYAELLMIFLLF